MKITGAFLSLLLGAVALNTTGNGMAFPPGEASIKIEGRINYPYISHRGGTAYLNIYVTTPDRPRTDRRPMNISVVLDRSGSMADERKIDYSKTALLKLVDQLTSDDILSIVIYDDVVEVLCDAQRVRNKREIRRLVQSVYPRNSTNLGGGMIEGFRQVECNLDREYVNRVIPALKKFYSELRGLVRRHYPHATSHLLKDTIHFEHDTRVFIVHEPLKTGEWQDPWEERGPKPGGILCDLELRKGKYGGAAAVPQTFDKRYFTVWLLAPYSAKHDCHLYVHLYYPRDVSAEFLNQFGELVRDFEKHMD